jgi:hypothetical protein
VAKPKAQPKSAEAKKPAGFKLAESVSSLQDLNAMILEIRDYARWYAHNDIKRRVAKTRRSADEPTLTPSAETVIRNWEANNPLSSKSLDELVATLEDYAKNAPQFTIILAAPPAAGIKKDIVAWCRDNVAPNVLVNFQFNSTILGGMVVRCGSRVYDWSFRRQILAAGPKFPEVLRSV